MHPMLSANAGIDNKIKCQDEHTLLKVISMACVWEVATEDNQAAMRMIRFITSISTDQRTEITL